MSIDGSDANDRHAAARQVDAVCDRFESAWKSASATESPPRLEDFLSGEPNPAALLRELIPLDVHYRRERGETPRDSDYSARFPELDSTWLASTLALGSSPPNHSFDLASYTGPQPTSLGRFRIRGELGRGGFGIVFLAEDPQLGREVALKVPRPEVAGQPELRQRFLREAHSAASLDHPNVAPVFEAGETDGVCYIASAYCPGGNLAGWIRRQTAPVTPRRAAALVTALAGAVQHAHDHGILHRDLKPSNILLVPAGEAGELEFIPKITDFGLAKLIESADEETTSGMLMGTPAYMAPEQVEGRTAAVGVATDVYALGVILYELLTGRPPLRGPSLLLTLDQVRTGEPVPPRQLRADVPRDLEVICLKCLQKSPRDRYASAADLAGDLQRFLNNEPIRARPVSSLARFWRWCRHPDRVRNAQGVAVIVGTVAAVVDIIGLGLLLSGILPTDNVIAGSAYFLFFIFGFGLPNLWIGLVLANPSRRALWCGFLLPIIVSATDVCFCLDVIPSGGMTNMSDNPVLWFSQAVIVSVLFSTQIGSFALAVLAHSKNRQAGSH